MSWADGAVTAAAQHVSHSQLYGGTALSTLPVSETAAQQAVADYVASNGLAGRFDEFQVAEVSVDPGTGRVSVQLTASVPLMLAGDVTDGMASFTLTARSTAVIPLE